MESRENHSQCSQLTTLSCKYKSKFSKLMRNCVCVKLEIVLLICNHIFYRITMIFNAKGKKEEEENIQTKNA